jgi:putative flippase GtrA
MKVVSTAQVESPAKPLSKNAREIILYVFFGGLTTLVNLISFYAIDLAFPNHGVRIPLFGFSFDPMDAMNITVSWIVAVLFAYFTNRIFVFRSKGPVRKELLGFFASRIATLLLFEIGLFFLGIYIIENFLGYDKEDVLFRVGDFTFKYKLLMKILIAVFVVIGNYVLSKIFVFRKRAAKNSVSGLSTGTNMKEERERDLGD